MSDFNILSLFDGISCGQLALQRVGVQYDNYYASEIDEDAIKVTQNNFPSTLQLGDVRQIQHTTLPKIDLLIGGSPCQGFSFIGKQLNFKDPRSTLFFEFARLLKLIKPKYFLLENVVMSKISENIITEILEVEPMLINSSLVSAQNRKRLYWTNIQDIKQPEDKYIFLDDIINHQEQNFRIPKNWFLRVPNNLPKYVDPYNKKEIQLKSTTLRTNVNNGNMWVKVNGGYRNLTRTETELLQTVPINYTGCISENKAKKCLSNGWTVDIIAHIFRGLKNA